MDLNLKLYFPDETETNGFINDIYESISNKNSIINTNIYNIIKVLSICSGISYTLLLVSTIIGGASPNIFSKFILCSGYIVGILSTVLILIVLNKHNI
tara:strand:+ start:44 stop:337 length:294 start_codon:yes stop_codon:yes gene_type:complete